MRKLSGQIVILAADAGRHTGWSIYAGETLVRFGQFYLADDADVDARLARILRGDEGYPYDGPPLRPALAVVEEHDPWYHAGHGWRGSRSVGERRLQTSMKVNVQCRRRFTAALYRAGIPSLGITPNEWRANDYALVDVLAQLAWAGIAEPGGFRRPAREHERDAIVMGGRVARRRVWEVR